MRSMRHASQKGISGEMNSHTTKSTIHENNDVKDVNESSQIGHILSCLKVKNSMPNGLVWNV